MTVFVQIALLDADGRLLLQRMRAEQPWDMPGMPITAATSDEAIVDYAREALEVTTFSKALFPLTFCQTAEMVHIVYGCRNWIGLNGLQSVPDKGLDSLWVKPARLLDHPVSDACRMMAPNLMSLIG